MRSEKPIPKPTEKLKELCNADNQFSNFDRMFRTIISVPKSEILRLKAKEKHRNLRARERAKKK